ncbi:hypothetical protein J2741_000266 [Methanolinea mesophila]|uniref:hypothetical protein n=1 Tax=Methanolinea mesophila TaxID=547055 RepID=UPI001AE6F07E|nr:hypothetical protein [Methanolinea mesophila]MBP1927719.1 hypothetical protein [Methanolinea mesophila]
MADFVQTINTKTAVRELSTPIADVNAFNGIIQGILDDNPFGCTSYIQNDVTQDPVMKSREAYTARINFEDNLAATVGYITARAPSIAGFTANITELLANEALATAMGGDAVRDTDRDSFTCTLKCHDPSGEIYYVAFTRDHVTISSYSDDAIRTAVETWADTVPALA